LELNGIRCKKLRRSYIMDRKDEVKYYVTKAGIKIGEFYERKPPVNLGYDMELIQLAILNDQGYIRRERLKSIGIMLSVCGFLIALMLFTKN
jgi:hypothetical protein